MAEGVGWVDTAVTRRASSRGAARAERRQQIIAAAIAAIEEDGPGTMTGRIADRAGLARTHVYRHFSSKEELDLDVARSVHQELTGRIRATLEVQGTPVDIIRAPVTQHVIWADEHPNLYRFMVRRDYRLGHDEPRIGGSAFASELAAVGPRCLPRLDAHLDALDGMIIAALGLIDASVSWWLRHRDASRDELIERLTAQTWLVLDYRLREVGIQLDPDTLLSEQ